MTGVTSVEQLRNALAAGETWITLQAPIEFAYEAEAINLDAVVPQSAGNRLTIQGGGDWNSGQINRVGSFPTPLIYAGNARHWEYRLRHCIFDGWRKTGPFLKLDYMQLSIVEDVTFQNSDDHPFILGENVISATEFRDVNLHWNFKAAYLKNVSDVRWRGGSSHCDWGGNASGLVVIGAPTQLDQQPQQIGGPFKLEDIHCEGTAIKIINTKSVKVRGGYWFVSSCYIEGCWPIDIASDGYFYDGSIFVNSVPINGNTV